MEQQVEEPTCVRVDTPQGPGQQGSDCKGCKGDPNHSRSVQDVQRAWEQRNVTKCKYYNVYNTNQDSNMFHIREKNCA